MPLKLIAGNFKILNTAPDGDSIKFYPDDPNIWKKLGIKVRANHAGGVQLRLDGIDALETHYQPRIGSLGLQHQPKTLAHSAAAELLKFLGFDQVTRDSHEVVTAATPQQLPGFILTRFADTYGRSVAFVFKGNAPGADGSDVYLDKSLLHQSANDHLLAAGLVYPTFYSKLYVDLQQEMTKSTDKARHGHTGIWQVDKTTEGFVLEQLRTITDKVVILPKLFRRLLDYLAINGGSVSLAGFKDYLESRDDRLIILPNGHITGFDYVVEVNAQTIKLTQPPERLVFIEQ